MPYADKYKKKGSRYEDERSLRAAVKERERREARRSNFTSRRNIEEDILKPLAENLTGSIKGKMNLRLLQWKQKKERERQEAIEKKKKKPPFVVGVVHHEIVPKFPSPVNSGKHNKSIKGMAKSITMKLHQVMVKKSFAPICHEFKAPSSVIPILMVPSKGKQNTDHLTNKRLKKEPNQACHSKGKSNFKKIIEIKQNEVKPRRSARLTSKTKEAPEGRNLPEIKNSPAQVLNSIESGNQHVEDKESDLLTHPLMFAASFSPFICRARGKERHQSPAKKPETPIRSRESGLRRQIAKKIIEEKLNDHLEMKKEENWLTKENILAPSEDQNITSFRKLHSDEMRRLGSLCLDWDALLMSQEIPTEMQDSVRTTVCQARLLMREKLAQFKDLVDKSASCEPSTQCKVTHSDLQGFWDLVSIQIEDINNKFKKLDDLKCNNWVEIVEEVSVRKQCIRKINKEPMKTKKLNVEKKSAFQLFLKEQKRNKEANEATVMILTPSSKISKCSPKQRRKSTRISGAAHKEGESCADAATPKRVIFKGESCAVATTPRRVTFKGLDGDTESPRNKLPATPHIKKVSFDSSKRTPTTPSSNKRRSRRLVSDSIYCPDEG